MSEMTKETTDRRKGVASRSMWDRTERRVSETPMTDAIVPPASFIRETRLFDMSYYIPLLEHARTLERSLNSATERLKEDCEDCDHGIRGGKICESCSGYGRVLTADLLTATQRHVKELESELAEARRKNDLALGPDCHGYLKADVPDDITTIKYVPACVAYKARAESLESRLTAQAEALESLRASIAEVAIPSLMYCETRYGHDDQARVNLQAALSLNPDKTEG